MPDLLAKSCETKDQPQQEERAQDRIEDGAQRHVVAGNEIAPVGEHQQRPAHVPNKRPPEVAPVDRGIEYGNLPHAAQEGISVPGHVDHQRGQNHQGSQHKDQSTTSPTSNL